MLSPRPLPAGRPVCVALRLVLSYKPGVRSNTQEAHRHLAARRPAVAAMGDVSGTGFAPVASGIPIVALDCHRLLVISGDAKNRAKLAKAIRKWKELSWVLYPDTVAAGKVAHELLGRRGYAVEAVAVGYDTPTNYASMSRVVPATPCPERALYGATGPGALACRAALQAGYRHGMSVPDAIELVGNCVAEMRRLRATEEFAVWYIDRDGAVPVKKEIMEAMARGRQMAIEFFNSVGEGGQ